MLKKRLIPTIFFRDGSIVQSRLFSRYQILGHPMNVFDRLNSWAADEVVFLNISTKVGGFVGREDKSLLDFNAFDLAVQSISKKLFVPLTVGGKIKTLVDIDKIISLGADKICINTVAIEDPAFIEAAAKKYGSQCIVVSIDAKKITRDKWVVVKLGSMPTNMDVLKWARRCQDLGAGEILLNSTDRDGTSLGLDLELLKSVVSNTQIPIVGLGGAGSWEHLKEAAEIEGLSGVSAGNIFHHSENSVYNAKKFLYDNDISVRKPSFFSLSTTYDEDRLG